jgi:hypothetical protein
LACMDATRPECELLLVFFYILMMLIWFLKIIILSFDVFQNKSLLKNSQKFSESQRRIGK